MNTRLVAASAALLALPAVASAQQPPRVRLDYDRGDATSDCPGEQALRDLVTGRLGRDPFDSAASMRVGVELAMDGGSVVGRLTLYDAEGQSLGEQRFRAPAQRCGELLSAVAMATAVALDPASGMTRSSGEDGDKEAASADTAATEPATGGRSPRTVVQVRDVELPPVMQDEPRPAASRARSDDAGRKWQLVLALGPTLTIGRMPDAAPGGALSAWLERGRLALGMEGAVHVSPGPAQLGDSAVRTFDASLSGLGCVRVEPAAVCAVAAVSLFEAQSAAAGGSTARATVPRGGLRVRARWRPVSAFAVSAWAQADVAFVQPSLRVGGHDAWSAPPVAGIFGLSAALLP